MNGRLVVGVDGSSVSTKALKYAARAAVGNGDELEIVTALNLPVRINSYGTGRGSESLSSYAERLLNQAKTTVNEQCPGLACHSRYEFGRPSSVLVAASKGAAALVVGTSRVSVAGRTFLASVTTRLATQAACPLFVVPEETDLAAFGPIVVGIDDSAFSDAALRFAMVEADRRDTWVRAVAAHHVPAVPAQVGTELLDHSRKSDRDRKQKLLSEMIAKARDATSVSVEVEGVTVDAEPAEAILFESREAQLIVLGSHGKGWVPRGFSLGSECRTVLHGATGPVAVINVENLIHPPRSLAPAHRGFGSDIPRTSIDEAASADH